MIETIAKLLVIAACPFISYGFGITFYRTVYFTGGSYGLAAFVVGFIVFLAVWKATKRHLDLICNLEHEITHVVFGLLFLKIPRSFVVTRHDGGHVTMAGTNFVITLAPYFFPTVSFVVLPLSFFVDAAYLPAVYGILGASVAFHLVSTWAEIHWQQTDLHKAGILFSFVFLPVANLVFYGALLAMVFAGTGGFLDYWVVGSQESLRLLISLTKM